MTINTMTGTAQSSRLYLVLFLVVTSLGCAPQSETRATTSQPTLPVSLNEVMVAMVNNAADPIWLAAWRHPESDEEWRAAERAAYQVEIAGSLLAVPGTGPLDKAWTSDPEWIEYCEQLTEAGREARIAISNRDLDAIQLAGNFLVQVCEACHIAFKPDLPTGDIYGELSPTEADLPQQ